jgi:hypothetical protein
MTSDISGQDIWPHGNKIVNIIQVVRDMLADALPRTIVPGGSDIYKRYRSFRLKLPALCKHLRLDKNNLSYNDYVLIIEIGLKKSPR